MSASSSESIATDEVSSDCGFGLHGSLDEFGLPTLLTFLDMERRSGLLSIRNQGLIGRLWLCRGRVVRARIDGAVRRSRKPAVFEMLGWGHGRFDFTLLQVDVGEYANEIGSPTTRLLMEAARRADESRRHAAIGEDLAAAASAAGAAAPAAAGA
jgi:Domain of unknown function (DUF4388)